MISFFCDIYPIVFHSMELLFIEPQSIRSRLLQQSCEDLQDKCWEPGTWYTGGASPALLGSGMTGTHEGVGQDTEMSKTEQWTLQVHAKIFTARQQKENSKDMKWVFLKAQLINLNVCLWRLRPLNVIKPFLVRNNVIINKIAVFIFKALIR